jgi:hypothetical protein
MTYNTDYALGEEDENLEYQSYYQGYFDELVFAGNTGTESENLARQLALKAMKGQSFTEAEKDALVGILAASQVDIDF